ncbi:hypothetical protein KDK_66380 [Dictyobacter kobayashii]|uniref:Uncharacterized protein n=1 Tax=Dictyobacter kobayashii TaxID=2014872 RepID=A0A402AUP2_9CHLR|nr:hypothetical protein KDK_66380 [Dictyobacter kobayashii]
MPTGKKWETTVALVFEAAALLIGNRQSARAIPIKAQTEALFARVMIECSTFYITYTHLIITTKNPP